MAIFQSPKNIFQRPKFPGKSLKFCRKSDFLQISGSEIRKLRARKNAIPYPQPFHTPTRLPPRNAQESGRKAPLSCNAAFSMLQCSFSFAAAQLLVQMTSALQKSRCCSAVSAAQHSENCSATSVFACGMLQGRSLEGWGLGLAEK